MSIADKLTQLNTIKQNIKSAIQTMLGASITDNMNTYADCILRIPTDNKLHIQNLVKPNICKVALSITFDLVNDSTSSTEDLWLIMGSSDGTITNPANPCKVGDINLSTPIPNIHYGNFIIGTQPVSSNHFSFICDATGTESASTGTSFIAIATPDFSSIAGFPFQYSIYV